MQTYVILLRGVMPTGRNKLLMAPLRGALEQAGLADVRTYIQSGNIVATSSLSQPASEQLVHEVIAEQFGGDIVVLARTAPQFHAIHTRNPFRDADPARLYVTLLAATPDVQLLSSFLAQGHAPDQVAAVDDAIYIHCATRYSDVKATNTYIERKLQRVATTRISHTIARLVQLSGEGLSPHQAPA